MSSRLDLPARVATRLDSAPSPLAAFRRALPAVRQSAVMLLVALPLATPLAAATPAEASRPRVGLALGGGSAKGIAHVGVLKWLEENRVPVDVVAGTSMGGLVGGAYATGMSAAEIQQLLANADWDLIFKADAPYRLKGYRRKQDALDYPVKLELGLRGGLSLPSGLNPGHHIGVLLSSIALPYSTVSDFDQLPIPFRCVATDMEKGEVVVLGHGSLGSALRATMAIPGVFDPVRLEGRLLSDGGILNNVPVDVAREMGADFVIAVKVGDPSFDEVSETILGLADRAIGLMMESLAEPRLAEADLLILPDLKGVSGSDYRNNEALVQLGYDAATAHAQTLRRFALDEAAWQEHLAARRARGRTPPEQVAFWEVTGVPERAAGKLVRLLERRTGGRLEEPALAESLDRLIGTGRYAAAAYGLVERDGRTGLDIDVRKKAYAPPFVNSAIDVNNEQEDVTFNFSARTTFLDLTGYGSELRLEGGFGSTLFIAGELLQPLGGTGLYLAPRAAYARFNDNLYADEQLVGVFKRERTGGGADLVLLFGVGELRAGYEEAYLNLTPRVGTPEFPGADGREQVLRATFASDTRDAAYFARRGVRLATAFSWYLEAPEAEREFGRLDALATVAFSGAGADRGLLSAEGGALVGPEAPGFYQPSLGGPFRLGAFGIGEFRGRYTLLGRAGYLRSLAKLPEPLADRLYLVGLFELGSAFERVEEARLVWSATAGLALDTFFGPGFVGASVGSGGAFKFYFTIGKLFR